MSMFEVIEFDKPPTVKELIVALELLEQRGCGSAHVRVSGVIEMPTRHGPRLAAIRAERPAS